MKKLTIIILALIIFHNISAAQEKIETDDSTEIRFKYCEKIKNEKPVPDVPVFFNYLDIQNSTWKSVQEKTDIEGFTKFVIPLNNKGESYPFFITVSEDENSKQLSLAKEGKLYLSRIPADDPLYTKNEYIEIWKDKKGSSLLKVGPLQICTSKDY